MTQGKFSFREPLQNTGQMLFVPSSAVYLFEPQSISTSFKGECLPEAAHFVAEKGIFVDGRIQPTVKGVAVPETRFRRIPVLFR